MKRVLLLLLSFALCFCSSNPTNINDNSNQDGDGSNAAYKLTSIVELKAYYSGSTHQIVDDIYIEAMVVANDILGEFENRIVLQDSSGAIELYIDEECIYDSYPLYNIVSLSCSGLWLAARGGSNGAVVMGVYPTSYDAVDGLSASQLSSHTLSNKASSEEYSPNRYALSELTTTMVSSCFVIESLKFTDYLEYETLLDYDQYEELGYCRRTMECQQSGQTIDLYVPYSLEYRNVTIGDIERSSDDYLVLLDRYSGNYSIQLVTMGWY